MALNCRCVSFELVDGIVEKTMHFRAKHFLANPAVFCLA